MDIRGIAWMLAITLAWCCDMRVCVRVCVCVCVCVSFTFLCTCSHNNIRLDKFTLDVLLIMIPYSTAYQNSVWS